MKALKEVLGACSCCGAQVKSEAWPRGWCLQCRTGRSDEARTSVGYLWVSLEVAGWQDRFFSVAPNASVLAEKLRRVDTMTPREVDDAARYLAMVLA